MKNSEVIQFSDAELFEKLKNFKQEHMNLRFQVKLMSDSVNPNKLSLIRKNIAKIMTEITQRKNKNKSSDIK